MADSTHGIKGRLAEVAREYAAGELSEQDFIARTAAIKADHDAWKAPNPDVEAIREYFKARLTYTDLAREAGVSKQYVWRVTSGRAKGSDRVVAAAKRLGIIEGDK